MKPTSQEDLTPEEALELLYVAYERIGTAITDANSHVEGILIPALSLPAGEEELVKREFQKLFSQHVSFLGDLQVLKAYVLAGEAEGHRQRQRCEAAKKEFLHSQNRMN